MRLKSLLVSLFLLLFSLHALSAADEVQARSKKYDINAAIRFAGTSFRNYTHAISGDDWSNFYVRAGFNGKEFDDLIEGSYLRFGATGAITFLLWGEKSASHVAAGRLNKAVMYEAYVGIVTPYIDISAGREAIELEWFDNHIEGARMSLKVPDIVSLEYYFISKQGKDNWNRLHEFTKVDFYENVRKGYEGGRKAFFDHAIVLRASNIADSGLDANLYEIIRYKNNIYGLNLAYNVSIDDGMSSSTSVKYAITQPKFTRVGTGVGNSLKIYMPEKKEDTTPTLGLLGKKPVHFLHISEEFKFNPMALTIGYIKLFGAGDDLAQNADSLPLWDNSFFLLDNASSGYINIAYEDKVTDDLGISANIAYELTYVKPMHPRELNVADTNIKKATYTLEPSKTEYQFKGYLAHEIDVGIGLTFDQITLRYVFNKLVHERPTYTNAKSSKDGTERKDAERGVNASNHYVRAMYSF